MANQCTWQGQDGLGCTHTALAGKSYCAEHYPLVYKVGSAVKRKKDTSRYDRIQMLIDDFNAVLEELEAEGWTPEWEGEVGRL